MSAEEIEELVAAWIEAKRKQQEIMDKLSAEKIVIIERQEGVSWYRR